MTDITPDRIREIRAECANNGDAEIDAELRAVCELALECHELRAEVVRLQARLDEAEGAWRKAAAERMQQHQSDQGDKRELRERCEWLLDEIVRRGTT